MVSDSLSESIEQRVAMNAVDLTSRTPLTLIIGIPGSGKSTLLNRIIRAYAGTRFGIVANEFGRIAFDNGVIRAKQNDVVIFTHSGLFSRSDHDLTRAVRRFGRRRHEIDHILVEASGLLDPRPVTSYFLDGAGRRKFELGPIVCVLDAARIEYLAATYDILFTQLKHCDFVYVTRVAELAVGERRRLEGFLAVHAPNARLLTDEPDREVETLIALGGIDAAARGMPEISDRVDTLLFEARNPLEEQAFRDFLTELPPEILRAKGVVRFSNSKDRKFEYLLQISGSRVALDARKQKRSRDTGTRILLLGREIDKEALRGKLESCVAAETQGP
ncbi:MAG: CobW family GTP-binding protein [Spirochaetia bacterium]